MTALLPAQVQVARAAATRASATWWGTASAVYSEQLNRSRVARIPLLFVATFQSVGILALLRGVVAAHDVATQQQVVAGSTVTVVAFVALNLLAQRLGNLKANGGLDRYGALPVPGSAVVLGTAAGFATFTIPGTIVTALFGALLYGLPLGHLWVLVPLVPLAGAALAGVGAVIGLLAPKVELATVGGQLGMSAVLFVSIIPASRLPAVLRALRLVLPSTWTSDALAHSFRHHVDTGLLLADLAVCAGVAVVSLALAGWAFRRATTRR